MNVLCLACSSTLEWVLCDGDCLSHHVLDTIHMGTEGCVKHFTCPNKDAHQRGDGESTS